MQTLQTLEEGQKITRVLVNVCLLLKCGFSITFPILRCKELSHPITGKLLMHYNFQPVFPCNLGLENTLKLSPKVLFFIKTESRNAQFTNSYSHSLLFHINFQNTSPCITVTNLMKMVTRVVRRVKKMRSIKMVTRNSRRIRKMKTTKAKRK